MDNCPRIVWWRLFFERLNHRLDVVSHLFRFLREVAQDAFLRDAMVVDRRLEFDSRLLLGKLGADGHPDLENTSVEMRHWLSKVIDDPDEWILVIELDRHVVDAFGFVVFCHLLKLT